MQSALQTERDSLQQRLSQAEKDLEAARAAVSSSSAGGSAGPVTEEEKVELQQRVEAIEREKEDYVRVCHAFNYHRPADSDTFLRNTRTTSSK